VGEDPIDFRRIVAKLREDAAGQRLILLLDEVDEILDHDMNASPPGRLFKTLRALAHEGATRIIFSGCRALHRHLHDSNSPFFNFCEEVTLRPLDDKSVIEVVTKPMEQLGIALGMDAADREALLDEILAITSCHPNLVQLLCDEIVKLAESGTVRRRHVIELAERPAFVEHFLETAWGDSTALERLVSACATGPFTLDSIETELQRYVAVDRVRLRAGLDMLEVNGLLRRDGERFAFALTRFPEMLRRHEDAELIRRTFAARVERP
jgi:hypothetical protein